MKILELLNAVQMPITNEEAEVLDKFNGSQVLLKADLSPREQLLANNLVNKDVLDRRRNDEGKIQFIKKIRED